MRLRLTLAAVCYLSASLPAPGQQFAAVSLTGRVQPAWKIEAEAAQGDTNYAVSAHSEGPEVIRIETAQRGSGPAPEGTVTVVVALRTNAERFRLFAHLAGGPAATLIGAPQPGGNGSQLSAQSVADFQSFAADTLATSPGEHPIAAGSRISTRGSFHSPDNALLVPIRLRIPASPEGAARVLRIRIGS